ncbi:hypothetical protein H6G76_05580 [Nostoc sp. FACHB-152]|uniref:hypothetical protein n=1 Tax=unclassified Nostoc TaxID=2593658 RepID=UPI0016857936|nr:MULTISPECIES: hypothetical protein [unclassified Nostoc]MBD2446643.1 hypothetical protein [Nostoc sp. FACHB-152]MBD2466491.1 hypothetical protein [Nostoc sp. FACHB-145]
MLNISNLFLLGGILATFLAGSLVSAQYLFAQNFRLATQPGKIASLVNGNYQLCSQPDPKDWRDGAGVCFNFSKTGNRVNGYYGYPHSEQFICIRGIVDADACGERITGEGLGIAWDNFPLKNTPESAEFKWDSEGHLTLSKGNIFNTVNADEDNAKWILYRKASLNIEGFYQYNHPRMTPVSQLCQWNFK